MHTDGQLEELTLAQRISKRHGGQIWAESKVVKGATFSFSVSSQALTDEELHEQLL